MKTKLKYLFNICFLGFLLMVTELSYAQRQNIIISKDLSNNANMMKVKMGAQWMGRIMRFKFGNYVVEKKSKLSSKRTKQKANILGTKNQYETRYKFHFLLSNKNVDTAIVDAVYSENVKELASFELFSNVSLGRDEVLKDWINFTADVTLSSEKDNIWKLYLKMTEGTETEFKNEGLLTFGDRIILINAVSSNPNGNDKRWFPALGYEFTENEKALCAVQYFGGGGLGYNKNIIWMDSGLDPKMKLILAATMTAIMQIKLPQG